ncbi:hypothetical protein H0W91_03280 [Patescibacteria group bacterium]|nr:hypothetical protein [Patescibacteria group bacterium]
MEQNTQTPSNDGEIMVERDEKGRIKPGSILNPGGKPKGIKHLTTLLSESLAEDSGEGSRTYKEEIIAKVIDMAKKGDMRAIELVWDRIEGKATQSIHNINQNIVVSTEAKKAADEAIDEFLQSYSRKKTQAT